MSVKKYTGGAWQNISSAKRYSNGTWREVSEVKAYKNGAWERVFPDEVLVKYCSLDLSEYEMNVQCIQVSENELKISFRSNIDTSLLFYLDCSQIITDVEFIFSADYSPDDDFNVSFFRNSRKVLERTIEAGESYVSTSGFAEQIVVSTSSAFTQISQLNWQNYGVRMPSDIDWHFYIRSAKNKLKWK